MTNPSPAHEPLPSRTDQEAIRKLGADWIAAVKAKDIPALTGMVTEDVVFLPPGLPEIRGRQAVEAMYRSFFPQFKTVAQTAVIEEVEVAGDWAFTWGTETLSLTLEGGGPPVQMQGTGMSILRRQPDGSWKFARGINNSLPRRAV